MSYREEYWPQILLEYANERCEVCGEKPSDPAHIISRKAGGPAMDFNLLALCRNHHSAQHACGWHRFCEKHPMIYEALAVRGWVFTGHKLYQENEHNRKFLPGFRSDWIY